MPLVSVFSPDMFSERICPCSRCLRKDHCDRSRQTQQLLDMSLPHFFLSHLLFSVLQWVSTGTWALNSNPSLFFRQPEGKGTHTHTHSLSSIAGRARNRHCIWHWIRLNRKLRNEIWGWTTSCSAHSSLYLCHLIQKPPYLHPYAALPAAIFHPWQHVPNEKWYFSGLCGVGRKHSVFVRIAPAFPFVS